jgi:hypothetical protein
MRSSSELIIPAGVVHALRQDRDSLRANVPAETLAVANRVFARAGGDSRFALRERLDNDVQDLCSEELPEWIAPVRRDVAYAKATSAVYVHSFLQAREDGRLVDGVPILDLPGLVASLAGQGRLVSTDVARIRLELQKVPSFARSLASPALLDPVPQVAVFGGHDWWMLEEAGLADVILDAFSSAFLGPDGCERVRSEQSRCEVARESAALASDAFAAVDEAIRSGRLEQTAAGGGEVIDYQEIGYLTQIMAAAKNERATLLTDEAALRWLAWSQERLSCAGTVELLVDLRANGSVSEDELEGALVRLASNRHRLLVGVNYLACSAHAFNWRSSPAALLAADYWADNRLLQEFMLDEEQQLLSRTLVTELSAFWHAVPERDDAAREFVRRWFRRYAERLRSVGKGHFAAEDWRTLGESCDW